MSQTHSIDPAETVNEALESGVVADGLGPLGAVSQLVLQASSMSASDLFFAAERDGIHVFFRHLGVLREQVVLPLDFGRRCIAHIKASAGMDISERRRPMDGRWVCDGANGKKVDLRISSIPTLHGEDLSLRLLEREQGFRELEGLGLLRPELNMLIKLLNSPSGLVLVTGPTGAGKTTTLYACLHHLNDGRRKINTIEDPIEYAIEGVRQSQANDCLGVTFPSLLRSVLRQNPDVIMIGEIRDAVTAETAVRAANSGHLVFATLHSPMAATAIQSMLSLGVRAHFLASCLLGVVAQRLVRTLCDECKVSYDVSEAPHIFEEIQCWLEPGQGEKIFGPAGCPRCLREGYAGQTGVFEVLNVTAEIRKLIGEGRWPDVIEQAAVAQGMISVRQGTLLKVARGITSTEEVLRTVPAEYLGVDG